jgi:hypothetical protein
MHFRNFSQKTTELNQALYFRERFILLNVNIKGVKISTPTL